MTEAYDRVIAALPHLAPDERGRVIERLRALDALAPTRALAAATRAFPEVGDGPAGELLEIIAAAVLRAHGERVSPIALRRAPSFSAFRAKAGELATFAAKNASGRVSGRALLAVGIDCLYRDLRRAGMTVTARTLMACVHQVPAALDKSFPGYAQSGLLGMIVAGAGAKEEHDGDEAEEGAAAAAR